LGEIYSSQGNYLEAEPLLTKVLEIKERKLGQDHLEVANSANRLALLYYCEANYTAAEPLYRQALQIREKNLGATDPATKQTLEFYAALLRQEGRKAEARQMEAKTVESSVAHFQ
jgi:tetratricopeptide (TPR) repeat protein